MNVHGLDLRSSIFDVAISFQTIEHLRDPDLFIDELKRVIRSAGTIIISTPNVLSHRKRKRFNAFHEHDMDFNTFENLIQHH